MTYSQAQLDAFASEADYAFRDWTIIEADNETLIKYLQGLSNRGVDNDRLRHREIIRGVTINHVLMQRHIDGLNRQNAITNNWVMALAIAALIATAVQTGLAIEQRLKSTATAPPSIAVPMAISIR